MSPARSHLGRIGASVATSLALVSTGAFGLAAAAAPAPATDGEGLVAAPADAKVVTGAYLVQFDVAPTSRGGSARAVAAARDAAVAAAGGDVSVTATYSALWAGAEVRTDADGAARLANAAGVRAVYPVITIEQPEPVTSGEVADPALSTAIGMTGADVAHTELGLTGEGVKVGIIDSGIDIDHPDLGGTGVPGGTDFPTARIPYGWDFVGDSYESSPTGENYQPVPHPDPVPDDCGGHGTHVAGIVGADGELTGVAPDVTFGAYRVFGCDGSTDSSIIIAAMERAAADGMDVVNMSLGAGFMSWPDYPTAQAADALVDQGVVVVASIGNNGTNGIWSAGAPGVGGKAIGVASADNVEITARYFTAGGQEFPYSTATGAPLPPESGTALAQVTGEPGTPAGLGCEAPTTDVAGKIAIIQRGTCTFRDKALAAQEAGAIGVVLYNNQPGVVNPTVEGEPPITIPVVMLQQTHGEALVELAQASPEGVEITWQEGWAQTDNPTGGRISDFSSWGLAADLTLKPDITAPGGSIHSTYPLELGGETTMGGTSMSSPHVAGAAALLLEADATLTPAQVLARMQNTAEPMEFGLLPGSGYLEPIHRQGAGMLDIAAAATTPVTVTPAKLSLGESEAGPVTRTLTLHNASASSRTFAVGSVAGLTTTGSPYAPEYTEDVATVTAPASVTVPAGGTASIDVTITAPEADAAFYGGFVTLTSQTTTLHVPFAGYAGDYQALDPLGGPIDDDPVLGYYTQCDTFVEGTCTDEEAGLEVAEPMRSFTMAPADQPLVLARFDAPAEQLVMRVYTAAADGTKLDPVHPVFSTALQIDSIGRSAAAGSIEILNWDGTRQHARGNAEKTKAVADGTYVLEVEVLKALGDAGNPDHVETWTSTPFQVDRDGDGNPAKGDNGKGKGRGNR